MFKFQKIRNVFVVNGPVFVFALLVIYSPLAAFVSSLLPDTFYTFSDSHARALPLVYKSFPVLFIFFYICLTLNKWVRRQDLPTNLLRQCSQVCFYIACFQWFLLVLSGIYGRFLAGMDRGELLGLEHKFLVSGTSFVYILAFIYAVRFVKGRQFLFLCLIFLSIDFLFMGKKFVFYLIALALFRFDSKALSKSIKPVIYALLGGAAFALAIYFIRSAVVGNVGVLSLYSFFAEFIGVVSTVGFALEDGQFIEGVFGVIGKLQPYYFNSVGHGLALHPVAYFVVVGGEYWLSSLFIYMIFFTVVFYFVSMLIGDLALLILLVNIIHFFRHGPDIFMLQFLSQAFFIIIIAYVGLLKRDKSTSSSLSCI